MICIFIFTFTGILSDVRKRYHVRPKLIGQGRYGEVRECIDRETHISYAIKTINKFKAKNINILQREIDILQSIDNPHIVQLVDVYEDEKFLHLIMELCTGGNLFTKILDKMVGPHGHYPEDQAARITASILSTMVYCHDVKHIVHRDLKPENIVFSSAHDGSPVKLIDFGLARSFIDEEYMTTRCGTSLYVAPEVLMGEYTSKCDIWSIGIIAYILLCGYAPFSGDSNALIFQSIQKAPLEFPIKEWGHMSNSAKDFVRWLLIRNPVNRPTALEAMKHHWIQQHTCELWTKKPKKQHQQRLSTPHLSIFDMFFCGMTNGWSFRNLQNIYV